MRFKITAINHYDVFPFNSGGSMAVRGLELGLSNWFDVNLITFTTRNIYADEIRISDHLTVYPILVPADLIKKQDEFYEYYGMNGETIYDSSINIMRWYHKNPYIIERVKEIARDSILMIAEHVYTWKILKTACPAVPAFYRAHNVEYDYKVNNYRPIGSPKDLLEETFAFEKKCCEEADHVLTVSKIEADRFMDLYKLPENMRSKFTDIHLGYEANRNTFVLPSARKKCDKDHSYCGFFISSDMPSALDAARACIDVARKNQDIMIYIAGRVGRLLSGEKDVPDNVKILGLISNEDKEYYLSNCDFAMNPVESGAGVNVKMFEYYAYGIPVISTAYGARGTGLTNGKEGIIAHIDHYSDAVRDFCKLPVEKKNEFAENAFKLLESEYSWKSIAEKTGHIAETILGTELLTQESFDKEAELFGFPESEPYLPQKEFYIRCAGNNGKKCLAFLRSKGLEPVAFVEKDTLKSGTFVEGVKVISLEEFLNLKGNSEIIVAVWSWMGITTDLIADGVSEDRISVSWGDTGSAIFHLSDMQGSLPMYYDRFRFKTEILEYPERARKRNKK